MALSAFSCIVTRGQCMNLTDPTNPMYLSCNNICNPYNYQDIDVKQLCLDEFAYFNLNNVTQLCKGDETLDYCTKSTSMGKMYCGKFNDLIECPHLTDVGKCSDGSGWGEQCNRAACNPDCTGSDFSSTHQSFANGWQIFNNFTGSSGFVYSQFTGAFNVQPTCTGFTETCNLYHVENSTDTWAQKCEVGGAISTRVPYGFEIMEDYSLANQQIKIPTEFSMYLRYSSIVCEITHSNGRGYLRMCSPPMMAQQYSTSMLEANFCPPGWYSNQIQNTTTAKKPPWNIYGAPNSTLERINEVSQWNSSGFTSVVLDFQFDRRMPDRLYWKCVQQTRIILESDPCDWSISTVNYTAPDHWVNATAQIGTSLHPWNYLYFSTGNPYKTLPIKVMFHHLNITHCSPGFTLLTVPKCNNLTSWQVNFDKSAHRVFSVNPAVTQLSVLGQYDSVFNYSHNETMCYDNQKNSFLTIFTPPISGHQVLKSAGNYFAPFDMRANISQVGASMIARYDYVYKFNTRIITWYLNNMTFHVVNYPQACTTSSPGQVAAVPRFKLDIQPLQLTSSNSYNLDQINLSLSLRFIQTQCFDQVNWYATCTPVGLTQPDFCCSIGNGTIYRNKCSSSFNNSNWPVNAGIFQQMQYPPISFYMGEASWYDYIFNTQQIWNISFFTHPVLLQNWTSGQVDKINLTFPLISGGSLVVPLEIEMQCNQSLYTILENYWNTTTINLNNSANPSTYTFVIEGVLTNVSACPVQYFNVTYSMQSQVKMTFPSASCATREFCNKIDFLPLSDRSLKVDFKLKAIGYSNDWTKIPVIIWCSETPVMTINPNQFVTYQTFVQNDTKPYYNIQGFETEASYCPFQRYYLSNDNATFVESRFDDFWVESCNQQPCSTVKVQTHLQYSKYMKFFVVGVSRSGTTLVSPEVTLFVNSTLPNVYPPLIPNFVSKVNVSSTSSKVIRMSKPVDLDDSVIEVLNFTVSPPPQTLFVLQYGHSFEINLNQTDPPVTSGVFNISFVLSDTRGLNTSYMLEVTLQTPPFLGVQNITAATNNLPNDNQGSALKNEKLVETQKEGKSKVTPPANLPNNLIKPAKSQTKIVTTSLEKVYLQRVFTEQLNQTVNYDKLQEVLTSLGFNDTAGLAKHEFESSYQGSNFNFDHFHEIINKILLVSRSQMKGSFAFQANITKITHTGQVRVRFNLPIYTAFIPLEKIDSSVLSLIIDPSKERDEDYDLNKLSFSWMVQSLSAKEMVIQLNFSNPQEVSSASIKDSLVLHFLEDSSQYFISSQFGVSIEHDIKRKANIPKQFTTLTVASVDKIGSASQQIMKTNLYVVVPLCILFKQVLQRLTLFWNSAIMMFHLPLLQVEFPAHVAQTFEQINPSVVYDLQKQLLGTDPLYEPPQELGQKIIAGYDTFSTLENIGSVRSLIVTYVCQMTVAVIIVRPFKKYSMKTMKFYRFLSKGLFWTTALIISTEGFMELLVSSFITFYHYQGSQKDKTSKRLLEQTETQAILDIIKQKLDLPVAIIIFIYCTVGIPALMIWILRKDLKTLREPEFISKWGYLYESTKMQSKAQVAYNLVFYLRRIAFVLIAFVLSSNGVIQLILSLYVNLFEMIYHGQVNPLSGRQIKQLDLFNQFAFVTITLWLVTFTELVSNLQVQFWCGWLIIILIGISLLVNLGYITNQVVHTCSLLILKYRRKISCFDKLLNKLGFKVKVEVPIINTVIDKKRQYLIELKTKYKTKPLSDIVHQQPTIKTLGQIYEQIKSLKPKEADSEKREEEIVENDSSFCDEAYENNPPVLNFLKVQNIEQDLPIIIKKTKPIIKEFQKVETPRFTKDFLEVKREDAPEITKERKIEVFELSDNQINLAQKRGNITFQVSPEKIEEDSKEEVSEESHIDIQEKIEEEAKEKVCQELVEEIKENIRINQAKLEEVDNRLRQLTYQKEESEDDLDNQILEHLERLDRAERKLSMLTNQSRGQTMPTKPIFVNGMQASSSQSIVIADPLKDSQQFSLRSPELPTYAKKPFTISKVENTQENKSYSSLAELRQDFPAEISPAFMQKVKRASYKSYKRPYDFF